jgi:hypothetical protein
VTHDEGVYMRRAMHVLNDLGPQDPASRYDHGQGPVTSYDHPYFGQLFLAGVLGIIGYPNLIHPSIGDAHSIEMLYFFPRILMGILAIVDTFLVYKIAEVRYNKTSALIASILFAVMPLSWILRRILLDSILLPFLLSSILFAIYAKDPKRSNNKKSLLILFSGIFLGLAIFTKAPAFTMIPLVAFLLFRNNNHNNTNLKDLGLWLAPTILIPLIWPAYSISVGQFDEWWTGILYQATERHVQGKSLLDAANIFFQIDPILLMLGAAGLVFAAIKKDLLILLWAIPYIVLLYLIGWVVHFHWIPILPIFCIATAVLIADLTNKINKKKAQILAFMIVSVIAIFGIVYTFTLIVINASSSQIKAAAFASQNGSSNDNITILSSPIYSWIFKYVFHKEHVFLHIRDSSQSIQTKKILLIVDDVYRYILSKREPEDETQIERLQTIYNHTKVIATFNANIKYINIDKYPFTSLKESGASIVEIRANY